MSQNKPARSGDQLGEFLRQYDEYLDGKRAYRDLPAAPNPPRRETPPPSEKRKK